MNKVYNNFDSIVNSFRNFLVIFVTIHSRF